MALLPEPPFGISFSRWFLMVFPGIMITYMALWITYCRTLHPLAKIPGPFIPSFTRLWYMYRMYVADMDVVQRALHEKYGPLVRIAHDEVFCADPAMIPNVYRTRDPLLKTDMYALWEQKQITKQPDQFTCIDEDEHSRYRKIILPLYSMSNVLKKEEYVKECTDLFMSRMKAFAEKGAEVDLGEWVQWFLYDAIGELYFGKMFGFMENEHDYGGLIASVEALLFSILISAVGESSYRPLVLACLNLLPRIRKGWTSAAGVQKAAIDAVEKRKEEMDNGSADRTDMLQNLVKIVDEKGDKVNFTLQEVTLEVWVAMMAGSDTTAITLRACFYYLMKNPTALAKCHAEIDAASASLSSPIQYAETKTYLPYVCASIKEAMRMFPSIPFSFPRRTPKDGIELCGAYIPGGCRVGINPVVVQYDKGVFGDDAEVFRPERWLVDEEKVKEMDKAMLLFGTGKRTCIGKNIALSRIYTLVPEVLRKFDIEMAHDRPWKTECRWFHFQKDIIVKLKLRE